MYNLARDYGCLVTRERKSTNDIIRKFTQRRLRTGNRRLIDRVEVFTARRYSELIEEKRKFERNFFIILRV